MCFLLLSASIFEKIRPLSFIAKSRRCSPRLNHAFRAARQAFRLLEDHLVRRHLDGEAFLAGATPTIADIAVFPAVALSADFGLGMEEFPRLLIWARRIHKLDGFITAPGVREVV